MLKYEDHCCDCATPNYPCRGSGCPNKNVPVHCCDKCNEEISEVYDVDGKELCEECLKEMFLREE